MSDLELTPELAATLFGKAKTEQEPEPVEPEQPTPPDPFTRHAEAKRRQHQALLDILHPPKGAA